MISVSVTINRESPWRQAQVTGCKVKLLTLTGEPFPSVCKYTAYRYECKTKLNLLWQLTLCLWTDKGNHCSLRRSITLCVYLHYMFITLVGMLCIVHGSFHEFPLGNEFKVHECITSSKQKFLLTVISIQTYIHTFIHTRGTVAHSSYSMGIFNQCPRYQFIYPGSPDGLKICCV